LKRIARQTLEHSFLPGDSLWRSSGNFQTVAACAADRPGAEKNSVACQKFLDGSERARVQWELEKAFAEFEKKY